MNPTSTPPVNQNYAPILIMGTGRFFSSHKTLLKVINLAPIICSLAWMASKSTFYPPVFQLNKNGLLWQCFFGISGICTWMAENYERNLSGKNAQVLSSKPQLLQHFN
ncbi:MAG TPA: hypothetical protein VLG76_01540 [Rhabdochlamydiaceae bacterium]|nr:hypothetical protein [Rhabdochlamydiaceae bacterium]HSX37581.1 hypothetical protein [Chlamydiales bacterium]